MLASIRCNGGGLQIKREVSITGTMQGALQAMMVYNVTRHVPEPDLRPEAGSVLKRRPDTFLSLPSSRNFHLWLALGVSPLSPTGVPTPACTYHSWIAKHMQAGLPRHMPRMHNQSYPCARSYAVLHSYSLACMCQW